MDILQTSSKRRLNELVSRLKLPFSGLGRLYGGRFLFCDWMPLVGIELEPCGQSTILCCILYSLKPLRHDGFLQQIEYAGKIHFSTTVLYYAPKGVDILLKNSGRYIMQIEKRN